MRATEKSFLIFLEGTDKQFVIPIYQRNYDWKKGNCKQLFNDLIDIVKDNYRSHFMGSIVSVYNQDSRNREYIIIDGQQRLTTISILLLAVHNAIQAGDLDGSGVNITKIREEYLIDKYAEESKKIKLKPIKNDYEAFCRLFDPDEDNIESSNITHNYNYFYNELIKCKVSIDKIYKAIESLIIVEIELKAGEDDPQLIFESLNSTGLALNEADKVRNFILMKLDKETQELYYAKYWNKIEKNTDYRVSEFLRHYLTIKRNKIPNIKDVYFIFKKYFNDNVVELEEFLIELLKYSEVFKSIITNQFKCRPITLGIKAINQLEVNVSYPFLMEMFMDFNKGIINEKQCEEVVHTVKNYVFRRIICEIPTNSLNKTFMTLNQDIKRHKNYSSNYEEICKYIFIKKESYTRFPDDEEFRDKFMLRDIYNLKSKNKLYLLTQLENYKNKEKVDIENLLKTKVLSIEHIMPQKLTDAWKTDLGDGWEKVHSRYLNTIGNITLTGYNSEMKNKTFKEKRDSKKGFKESKLKLNKYLLSIDTWNEEEIKERSKILFKEVVRIWNYPETTYEPEENEEKLYTLDDEKDFTFEKIISYYFLGEKYYANNWTYFYIGLLAKLIDLDQYSFDRILNGELINESLIKCFSRNKSTLRRGNEISNGVFAECNLSTENKLQVLRSVLDLMNIELNEVEFVIR